MTWKEWFWSNFNVILLLVDFIGLLSFTLHLVHDAMDRDIISWGKEECASVLGALLLALTGRQAGKAAESSTPPPPTETK